MSIIISSQTLYGRVNPYVYSNLRKLSLDAGAIFVEDMHPETAFVKLSWALSQSTKKEKVTLLMKENLCGEISLRSAPFDQFLS